MDAGWAALLGALIGGGAVVSSNLVLEWYRRKRDARSAAAIISGELFAMLELVAQRDYVKNFTAALGPLRQGQDVPFGKILIRNPMEDPWYERVIEKSSFLPPGTARNVALVAAQLQGVRIDVYRLGEGEFNSNPAAKLNIVNEALDLWNDTEANARKLIAELDRQAR